MDNEVVTRDARPQGGRVATMYPHLILDMDCSLFRFSLFFSGEGEGSKQKWSMGIRLGLLVYLDIGLWIWVGFFCGEKYLD